MYMKKIACFILLGFFLIACQGDIKVGQGSVPKSV